ncbi:sensor histidine kinase [Paracidovorax cattleyae]|uniref:sensor histidine kinase n=1 Tax=Paracidovorax cattleyae TaxID=80868 RepID=UPI001E4F4B55|nr:ATP-binding protein [Paracidovorax cattleyae]
MAYAHAAPIPADAATADRASAGSAPVLRTGRVTGVQAPDRYAVEYPGAGSDMAASASVGVLLPELVPGDEVLLAVLDNALKFSRPVAQPCIELQAQPLPDGRVEIGVRDNGVGFVPARAQQLFGVFQRLHPVSQFPGLGLGLARSKRFVERMDGEIAIDAVPAPPGGSAEGQGCRVRIVLPAAGA